MVNTVTIRKVGRSLEATSDDGQGRRLPAGVGAVGDLITEYRAAGYIIKADKGARALAEQWKRRLDNEQPPIRRLDSWNHQLGAYHFAYDRPATMLNMHMGTGKTKVTIDLIQNWQDARRVLIVCPASVRRTWVSEVAKHGAVPFKVVEQ